MKLTVHLSFAPYERKMFKQSMLGLINLIKPKYEVTEDKNLTRFDEIAKTIRLISLEGTGLSVKHLRDAIEGAESLREVLAEMAQWTEADWGFVKPEQLPLRQRMKAKQATDTNLSLVANPSLFVQQMAELRQSQIPGVEECIGLLQDALYRLTSQQLSAKMESDHDEDDPEETITITEN